MPSRGKKDSNGSAGHVSTGPGAGGVLGIMSITLTSVWARRQRAKPPGNAIATPCDWLEAGLKESGAF